MKNTNPAAESGAFIRRARGYSVVQNEALFNDRLSMSAKGLYALISARIDYTAVNTLSNYYSKDYKISHLKKEKGYIDGLLRTEPALLFSRLTRMKGTAQ